MINRLKKMVNLLLIPALVIYGVFAINKRSYAFDIKETLKIYSGDYERYILVPNINEAKVKNAIAEYRTIYNDSEYEGYSFEYIQKRNWGVLSPNQSLSFYNYHNLVGWLSDVGKNTNNGPTAISLAINKVNNKYSYLCYIDPAIKEGDTLLCQFDNKLLFHIYLPGAGLEDENYLWPITKDQQNYHIPYTVKDLIDIVQK